MKDLAKYKTEQQQVTFYRQCLAKFEEASRNKSVITKYYLVANLKVALHFAGPTLLDDLTSALAHLEVEPFEKAQLNLKVWDSYSTQTTMVKPPCEWSDFTDRGDIWGFSSTRIKTAFHWSEYSLNLLDHARDEALFWVEKPNAFPYWVSSSPFRTIFSWLLEKHQGQLVHAAAVGNNQSVVLITGKGGVGKSSTALKALNNGFTFLGDDYLALRKSASGYCAYSLYSSAKIVYHDLERYPRLSPYLQARLTDNQEKGVYFLYPAFQSQIRSALQLKAVLQPQIVPEEESSLVPVKKNNLLEALRFTTMAQLPYSGEYTRNFFNSLVESVSGAQIQLGSNTNSILKTLQASLQAKGDLGYQTEDSGIQHWPLISLVIPVYNGADFIGQALQNVASQGYPALEIIVIDDGSTDQTRQLIEQCGVDLRYLYQPNNGPASARNRGIREAAGQYLAFLDIDDYWPENTLKHLMEELHGQQEWDVVRGYAQVYKNDEAGKKVYLGAPESAFPDYIGAALYRTRSFAKVGLFDEELTYGEDKDWFNRARESGLQITRLNWVSLMVQRHGNNMTEGKTLLELNMLKTFKKQLNRQRTKSSSTPQKFVKSKPENLPTLALVVPEVYAGLDQQIEQIKQAYPTLKEVKIFGSLSGFRGETLANLKCISHEAYSLSTLHLWAQDLQSDLLLCLKPGYHYKPQYIVQMAHMLRNQKDIHLILGQLELAGNLNEHILDLGLCLIKRGSFQRLSGLNPGFNFAQAQLELFFQAKEARWLLPLFKKSTAQATQPSLNDLKESEWKELIRQNNLRRKDPILSTLTSGEELSGTTLEKYWNAT